MKLLAAINGVSYCITISSSSQATGNLYHLKLNPALLLDPRIHFCEFVLTTFSLSFILHLFVPLSEEEGLVEGEIIIVSLYLFSNFAICGAK